MGRNGIIGLNELDLTTAELYGGPEEDGGNENAVVALKANVGTPVGPVHPDPRFAPVQHLHRNDLLSVQFVSKEVVQTLQDLFVTFNINEASVTTGTTKRQRKRQNVKRTKQNLFRRTSWQSF